MASQIEQLRTRFNSLNTAQKKAFIDNLKQKLQKSPNAEYTNFLQECVSKYNTAVRAGSTTDNDFDDLLNIGSGSGGNVSFENRIDEYKSEGYIVRKRDNISVKLSGKIQNPKNRKGSKLMFILMLVGGALMSFSIGGGSFGFIIMPLFVGVALYYTYSQQIVVVSITTNGSIEETGNVLE